MCDINAVHGLFATGTIEVAPVTFICVCVRVCVFFVNVCTLAKVLM